MSKSSSGHSRFVTGTYRSIGFWGILSLVCLRVCVGWHFYMEGVAKVREGGFSSVGFLNAAKGPLAPAFQAMIPDFSGAIRLNKAAMEEAYRKYADQVQIKYGFDEVQQNSLTKEVDSAIVRLDGVYGQWTSQINEYQAGFERVSLMSEDPKRIGVESLRKQRDEVETKWRGLVKPILSDVDKIGKSLQLNAVRIATPEQVSIGGELAFTPPGAGPVSVSFVDKFIPIFDMSVGILLIIGLLTPVAGIAAGLFLASVVLTQFPGYPGTLPTYYQAIEMMACFVLAFTDSGRYAGLDFIPWSFWNRGANNAAIRAVTT
ncbi:MAG: hypothetical protein NTW52_01395 [Planctomycetota bacterium]|nr:hypothetical protein [Planctomycetota bacterium]